MGGTEKSDFHRISLETQALFVAFFVSDFIPWLGRIDTLTTRLAKNFFELDAFYDQVINEHMDPKRPRSGHEDFVDVMIKLQKDLNLTRDHIKGVLMNILLAGTDTGSATVVWAMTELIRNPRVMTKAQDEVRSVVGSKNKVEGSDLAQLHYLKLVVKETFRLHSPGPLLVPRETIRHCTINGYDILPKTLVFVNAMAIGRDPEYWKDPDMFVPERFINSEVDYEGTHFELIPFGAGRRICPGMSFGTMTVELTMANLVYHFNWEFPSGVNKQNIDMSEAPGIAVHKKSDLLVATKTSSSDVQRQE
ncbi:cytochrome P450 71A1-like protein [Cinnamomum micranthum f. kanehirae]|uniref:Cytochrome P450 71A1-like protein n=1 Tax=Cinnamomum micranthum f. kanehirae TaxID=337451 RepID=A0A443PVZ6_9MAGN|nr:cytochrome P450 71A1-like protein [Cinnamomum micranthum f. kanehirae]